LLLSVHLTPAACEPNENEAAAERPDVSALVAAYPDFRLRLEDNELVWSDGTRMLVNDGRPPKPFEELLVNPDIKDMFLMPYHAGPSTSPPGIDDDPGRVRNAAFFDKMYGDCQKGEVQKSLRNIKWVPAWGGGTLKVTTINHVAERLEQVVRELEKLPPHFKQYVVPSAGTYNCRVIAGTLQKSMHSYGAAIDINTKFSDYWRWPFPATTPVYKNRIPFEIVEVFERHGFIWGGKWSHFDTMHFEYRPELLSERAPKHLR
jgi:D-alanyl-D-alanine carboxypeptidase